jgi:hypothetical protein
MEGVFAMASIDVGKAAKDIRRGWFGQVIGLVMGTVGGTVANAAIDTATNDFRSANTGGAIVAGLVGFLFGAKSAGRVGGLLGAGLALTVYRFFND